MRICTVVFFLALVVLAAGVFGENPGEKWQNDFGLADRVGKELAGEIAALRAMKREEADKGAAVDKKAEALLGKWKGEEEQGEIYYAWMSWYQDAYSLNEAEKIATLGGKAIKVLKDPLRRAKTFLATGLAERVKMPERDRNTAAGRAKVAGIYFAGLKEVLEMALPDSGVGRAITVWDPRESEAVQKKRFENQLKEECTQRLIQCRDELKQKAVNVYVFAEGGAKMEELKDAAKSLKKEEHVKVVMEETAKQVEWRKASDNEKEEERRGKGR